MPRRPPPTSLRLVSGPTPPRSTPKHVLPCVPRPAFHPPTATSRGAIQQNPHTLTRHGFDSAGPESPPSLCVDISATVLVLGDAGTSPSRQSSPRSSPKVQRGPWDHSGSIAVPFDVGDLLTPMKRVVVSPGRCHSER
ncbi:hypothetical protein BDQ12DRAFT_293396 [Crucibulum laeve]|uniref:Uncharacterized protein n=1 Tax=Crucibulum laeve TaxID=68775 RepID=A0A5C3MDS5_9AGAR|nr:hypothetical protein BDQ12DRAFT_293396 [Crucibulum laeve]